MENRFAPFCWSIAGAAVIGLVTTEVTKWGWSDPWTWSLVAGILLLGGLTGWAWNWWHDRVPKDQRRLLRWIIDAKQDCFAFESSLSRKRCVSIRGKTLYGWDANIFGQEPDLNAERREHWCDIGERIIERFDLDDSGDVVKLRPKALKAARKWKGKRFEPMPESETDKFKRWERAQKKKERDELAAHKAEADRAASEDRQCRTEEGVLTGADLGKDLTESQRQLVELIRLDGGGEVWIYSGLSAEAYAENEKERIVVLQGHPLGDDVAARQQYVRDLEAIYKHRYLKFVISQELVPTSEAFDATAERLVFSPRGRRLLKQLAYERESREQAERRLEVRAVYPNMPTNCTGSRVSPPPS